MGLPKILCLHGSGVNATVFKIQLATLQRLLSKKFEFVFLSGPFERDAGDGILPFFDGCEPFFRWKSKTDDITFTSEEIEKQVQDLVNKTVTNKEEFVGILGFSQGGRVAAGLLAEQAKEAEEDMYGEEPGFKFGVFICTPHPPMTKLVYDKEEPIQKIKTPCVMVVGKQDMWYQSGLKMYNEYFDHRKTKLMEFDCGHRVPNGPGDMDKIVEEILRLYKMATGDD